MKLKTTVCLYSSQFWVLLLILAKYTTFVHRHNNTHMKIKNSCWKIKNAIKDAKINILINLQGRMPQD